MKKASIFAGLFILPMLFMQCTEVKNDSVWKHYTTGRATWYGPGFHGQKTASGETFNKNKLTAAHRTLKFGTKVRVTNLSNNKKIVVRINDRGPVSGKFVIDLSEKAAKLLDMKDAGVVPVKLEIPKND
jgi:rare lipoprotein A